MTSSRDVWMSLALTHNAPCDNLLFHELIENSQNGKNPHLATAVDPDEMWAGGMGNLPVPDDVVPTLPEQSRVAFEGRSFFPH